MTEQEALKRLKDILDEATTDENAICYVTDYDEIPLRLAIEALEKQIPKKWQYEMVNDDDTYVCPCCKEYWYMEYGTPATNEYNYCPNCGQALKWE